MKEDRTDVDRDLVAPDADRIIDGIGDARCRDTGWRLTDPFRAKRPVGVARYYDNRFNRGHIEV